MPKLTRIIIGASNPDGIFYSRVPGLCPSTFIPSEAIESLELGSPQYCYSPAQRQTWEAHIILKEEIPVQHTRHLVNLAVTLANTASASSTPCNCRSQAIPHPSVGHLTPQFVGGETTTGGHLATEAPHDFPPGTQITICKGTPVPQGWVVVANVHSNDCIGAAAGVFYNAITIEKL